MKIFQIIVIQLKSFVDILNFILVKIYMEIVHNKLFKFCFNSILSMHCISYISTSYDEYINYFIRTCEIIF